jgi:glycosyltransferase involved in cell wall biosynthesis
MLCGAMSADVVHPERTITVAVATCGRPRQLARCLGALAEGTRRPDELIVVDQAPCGEARQAVEQCGIAAARYLEQARRGVSASRNLALAVSSGTVLAVTDDDCVPDAEWLSALACALDRDPAADAVTGPILALGPRPPGTHAVALRAVSVAADHQAPILPWAVGSGGNFAAPRAVLIREGGWDERLGPGSPGQAAEDSELLYRILRGGGIVRSDPAVVVRHEWQTWDRRLQTRWSYGYGISALCGLWLHDGDRFTLTMLGSYADTHLRQLAVALVRLDLARIREHTLALASVGPGFMYGLRAARGRDRARSSMPATSSSEVIAGQREATKDKRPNL